MTVALRVQVCGPLVIDRGGERLDSRLPGRQGRLLLAYLALNRHRAVPRHELVAAVWPDAAPGNVDAGLSALLSKTRQVLGPDSLTGRSTVRFTVASVRVDLEDAIESAHRAESAIAHQDWTRAWAPSQIALFAGQRRFLDGEDGDEAYEWITDERLRQVELRRRALEAYGTACLGLGGAELAAAVRAGRALVDVAPFHETGTRLLMRALAAEGNPAEALRVYEALRRSLREQLGVSPSAATRAVYAELNA